MIEIFIITIPVGSSFPSDKREKKRKKVDIAKRKKECSFWRLLISSNEKTNRQNQIRK
ncbi:hypothetical protein LGV59_14050 [Bacteroides fragilis]|nr:hypothetical protein [Bacteroides fragilis]